jgi:hypothetical protein
VHVTLHIPALGYRARTHTVWRTVNPEFNEWFDLLNVAPGTRVTLSVFDKDTLSTDDPMGRADWVSALKRGRLVPVGSWGLCAGGWQGMGVTQLEAKCTPVSGRRCIVRANEVGALGE